MTTLKLKWHADLDAALENGYYHATAFHKLTSEELEEVRRLWKEAWAKRTFVDNERVSIAHVSIKATPFVIYQTKKYKDFIIKGNENRFFVRKPGHEDAFFAFIHSELDSNVLKENGIE